MGKAKRQRTLPPPEPPGGPRVQGITAILHPISDVSVGQGRREFFGPKEPMMPESSPGPPSHSEPAVGGPPPDTEDHDSRVGCLGSLFLLLAPFAFFAALLALDGLLP